MSSGKILVAEHSGVNVIKMSGDVRLTLCVSFDAFINSMFAGESFCSVLFDLTEAQAIDSTTLGLMAKISLSAHQRCREKPVVLSNNPGITRLLESMGFDDIFHIVSDANLPFADVHELPQACGTEEQVKARVLEAHRILMELNETNSDTFRELVETLESS
jgi:anti-anti-sigma factor